MTRIARDRIHAGLAATALLGSLAACASDPSGDTSDDSTGADGTSGDATDSGTTDSTDTSDDSTDTSDTGDTDAGSSDAGYADGTYTATGSYVSPGGQESVSVELTLADGVVTDVVVTPQASNPNSQRYQGEFADGIADQVVGEPIDELSVTKVAGSSLTSGGFNDALEQIKEEAGA